MTARYRMERNPDSGKNGNKMPLHPRLIPYETVSIKKLMKYAKSRSTYSEADIAGALQLITDLVTERLREGDNVEIEGLGFFSVSLQSRAVMSKTELRSESVRFKNVNFRCCQQLKKALKTMPLTRMKSSGHCAPGMADREELLYRYLDENSYITVRSYRYLIGLSDYSARKDLAALVASGRLVKAAVCLPSIPFRKRKTRASLNLWWSIRTCLDEGRIPGLKAIRAGAFTC